MAKFVIEVDVPDETFNPDNYPFLENPTAVEMIQHDIQQIENGHLSEVELLDIYLERTTKDPILEAKP